MSALQIKTLPQVVAGKFVDTFAVVDAEGNLIGSKAHRSIEEAEAELGGLKYYAQGLEFAKATAPEGAHEKSLVGKANVVASYLLWVEKSESGEAEEATETAEASTEAATQEEEF